MIAMLGMYDMPPISSANDRFWSLIRHHLGSGPDHLARTSDPWEIWRAPDLVFAQTCGLPYRTNLYTQVNLIGTPDYGLKGCPPGYYYSVLVSRRGASGSQVADFDGGRFAYNEGLSQSGWAAPMTHFSALGVGFDELLATGAHVASASAVAEGRADLAGLDALTWELLKEHDPVADDLRVIATTKPTPGLPYITAGTRDPGPIAEAVRNAIRDLGPNDRSALHLKGLVDLPQETYLAVPTPSGP